MAISYERLIQLIRRQIDDVYGNPSAAARAVEKYYAEKGVPIGNCSPTMHRIYNWTPEGLQPKRSTLLKYAEGMHILLSELPGEPRGISESLSAERPAPEDRKARAKEVVLDCIDNFQTSESCDVIEKTAMGLIGVEKSSQKAQGRTGPQNNAAADSYVSPETAAQEHDPAIAAEKLPAYGEKKTGSDVSDGGLLKKEEDREEGKDSEDKDTDARNDSTAASDSPDDGCSSDAGA